MQKTTPIVLSMLLLGTFSGEAQARRGGTAASAYLYGSASVIRAQGRAARNITRASINYEEARSRYIDNQLKWTEAYFAKKAINAAYVAQETAKRRESRERYQKNRPSNAPPRLSLSEFDPASGEIAWPEGLQAGEFGLQRQQVDSLFKLRASVHAAPHMVSNIRSAIESLRTELRKQIKSMAPTEYLACRKFLDCLAYEGTLPAG